MKKIILFCLILAFTISCGNEKKEENADDGNSALKVAYVTAGAMGDNGFTDSAVRGMKRIEKDFGAEIAIIENSFDPSKYAQSLEACFQWNPDVVFADAYGFESLYAQYADQYPDIKIINLDFVVTNKKETVSSVTFINEYGAFLAGVLAAKVTTSELEYSDTNKKVGFVGGNDIAVIRGFLHGFEQGIAYVDPSIEVLVNYVGDFFDPLRGKQAAKQLYSQGADIIFQAAGTSGSGVLEAAAEENKYVIGVDANQNGLYPGYVVSSVVKDLDGAVYKTFKMILDGTYKNNTHYEYDIGEAGLYLAIDEYSKEVLPESMINYLDSVESDIVSGKIKITRYTAK